MSPGTGLDLAAPLKFNHAANLPFSDRGTGISFEPATAFAHSSNEPVQALGTGITLDSPWPKTTRSTRWCVTPRSRPRATRGRRRPTSGSEARLPRLSSALPPATWCCVTPPAWSSKPQLRRPRRPMGSRGLPSHLRSGQSGCRAPAPGAAAATGAACCHSDQYERGPLPGRRRHRQQLHRFPDEPATTLSAASAAGVTNIKVASVAGFAAGQTIRIDTGANLETAVIATVGTAGATTVGTATDAGATVIPVARHGFQRRPDHHDWQWREP